MARLDPEGFLAQHLTPEVRLPVQCYFLKRIQSDMIQPVHFKKNEQFRSDRYVTGAFYKPIHLVFSPTDLPI
jgi:hypothetical protein